MKKYLYLFIMVLSLSFMFLPKDVSAKVESKNLKETVEEEIELFSQADGYEEYVDKLKSADLSEYSDDKNKINIYLFRGSTCSHCFDAVLYFANMAKDFGEYFNLVSYEVWSNEDNANLMQQVADKMGDTVNGVPYIVVGNKSWSGFTDSYGEDIKKVIKEQYDKANSDRDDIMKQIDDNSNSSNSSSSDIISVIVIVLVIGLIVFGVIIARKKAS